MRFATGIFFGIASFVILVSFNNCSGMGGSSSSSAGPPLNVVPDYVQCDLSGDLQNMAKLSDTCLGKVMDEADQGNYFDNFGEVTPNYPLASALTPNKSRWIYIPEGKKIDNSDPDNWIFPVGSIFWKEFANDNFKVETRVFEKISSGIGMDHWKPYTFYWTMDQTEAHYFTAEEFPTGPELAGQYAYDNYLTRDVSGTITDFDYKVPSRSQCITCHSGAKDMVLGVTGFQLYGQNDGWRLSHLVSLDLLSQKIETSYAIGGSENNRKVMGLMQSNCASCHSPFSVAPSARTHGILKLNSDATELSEMEPYRTLLANGKFVPGDPDNSILVCRMEGNCVGNEGAFMPPTIDGVPKQHTGFSELIRAWVTELQ